MMCSLLASSAVWLLAGQDNAGNYLGDDFLARLHQGTIDVPFNVSHFYNEFLELLHLMTDEEPLQRITAQALLDHHSFVNLSDYEFEY